MNKRNVTCIPLPGNSGDTPTGAMQFQDDFTGLFVRGDNAIVMMHRINFLAEILADHPDPKVHDAVDGLMQFADIIKHDVMEVTDR